MISRRMVIAEIAIGLLALLMIVEAAATIRLTETSQGPRHAFIGELIQVGLHYDSGVISSDESVVKPVGTTIGSPTVHYFIAALPGRALVKATSSRCPGCLSLVLLWAVEIDVG